MPASRVVVKKDMKGCQRATAEELELRLSKDSSLLKDEDYLRCWLELASSVEEPDWVIDRVEALGVGEDLALRWVAQAFIAEKGAKYALADEIFSRGAARDAQPRDLLAKRRREFDRRMKRHWLSVASSHDKTIDENRIARKRYPIEDAKKSTGRRRPLGVLTEAKNDKNTKTLEPPTTQSKMKINRKLVFSTAKRDVPTTTFRRVDAQDLTINSAIAAKEIDDIFFDGTNPELAILQDDTDDTDDETVPPQRLRPKNQPVAAAPAEEPAFAAKEESSFAIFCDG